MLRVREAARGASPAIVGRPGRSRSLRLAACAGLGLMIGAGVTIGGVSMVQAEGDGSIHLFHRQEAARRDAANARYASSSSASAYAPARQSWLQRIFGQAPDGRLTQPQIVLNPFADQPRAARTRGERPAKATVAVAAPDRERSFCVRMCDGFHSPIGFVRSGSDLKAHEALCQAANPGIPVKVFRLAAGEESIHEAVSVDGRSSYGNIPMAYAYQTKGDAACRPAIVKADERRVSILRDFTLRPGDSVVLDGKVVTFAGGRWPYSPRDFEDFRTTGELTKLARREIDQKVGISRNEAQLASVRRSLRVREANLREPAQASDAITLRGPVDQSGRAAPVRVVEIVAAPTPR